MGYQKAVVKLSTGQLETGYIFNGATFFSPDELISLTPTGMWLAERDGSRSSLSITDITVIPRPANMLRNVRRIMTTFASERTYNVLENTKAILAKASEAAKDAPITATSANEVFKRFSAYFDDFKITEKKGLRRGTFATTAEDAENVRTGKDAVTRYALENKQPANNRFTIQPAESTNLQRGIAQPAYGEPGGGVEVIFVNGTGDNTVSGPDILPEE
jgi:hypothetical protein